MIRYAIVYVGVCQRTHLLIANVCTMLFSGFFYIIILIYIQVLLAHIKHEVFRHRQILVFYILNSNSSDSIIT